MKLFAAISAAAALASSALPAAAAPALGPDSCVGGPVDPVEFGLALGIVQTILPPDHAEAMLKQMMQALMSQIQQGMGSDISDPGLQEILDRYMRDAPARMLPVVRKHLPAITNSMACAYVREFDLSELREISQFAQTPAGRHYLARSTALISDPSVAAENQAYIADLQPVIEASRDDLLEDIRAYEANKRK